ncbi:acyltransferase family protein [Erwinia sp. P7711]|uniref:acyltransferase n=1 Tax=Erwinia sp. P7711 TaxID=3141451 RepID=UPI003195E445
MLNRINNYNLIVENRYAWLDLMKASSCLMVILIHISAGYINTLNPKNADWFLFNTINSFSRSCVPLFFMASGYLFIKLKDIKIKNFLRLISCIIFYNLLCALYLCFYKDKSFLDIIKKSYRAPAMYHLWFFYSLLCCYSFFIFFSFKNKAPGILKIITGLFLCFFVFCYSFAVQTKGYSNSLNINYIINSEGAFYILYTLLGAQLGESDLKKIGFKVPFCLFIFSSTLITLGTFYLSVRRGYFDSALYNYNTFLVSISAVFLFITFKNYTITNAKVNNALRFISKYSLPIYGTHLIFVDFIEKINLLHFKPLDFIIKLIFVLSLSIMVSMVIKKMDYKSIIS